jgi:3-methylcrotonyl-CoA carboxylase alpha subunit
MPDRLHLSGDVELVASADGEHITLNPGERWSITPGPDGRLEVSADAVSWNAAVADDGDVIWVAIEGDVFAFRASSGRRSEAANDRDALTSPMPATVVRVAAVPGQSVQQGDVLLTLEAMKMQWPLRAPRDGVVKSVPCREGEIIQPGTVLVEL